MASRAKAGPLPTIEDSGDYDIEEEGGIKDDISLKPHEPSVQPSSPQSPGMTENFAAEPSGSIDEVTDSRPQPRQSIGNETTRKEDKHSPATSGFSSLAGLDSSGLDLGARNAHSPNLGSSAESGKHESAPAPPGATKATANTAVSRLQQSVLHSPPSPHAASGRTSPAPNSSFDSFGVSFDSENSSPHRPQSPAIDVSSKQQQQRQQLHTPHGAAQGLQGREQATEAEVEISPGSIGAGHGEAKDDNQGGEVQGSKRQGKEAKSSSQPGDAPPLSTPQAAQRQATKEQKQQHLEQQQHQQDPNGTQQQQQGIVISIMESPKSARLPPGLKPEATAPTAAELQAAREEQEKAMAAANRAIQQEVFSSTCDEAGIDIPSPLQLFMMYDRDGNCAIEVPEFGQMLFDLDGMEEVPPAIRDKHVFSEFDKADLNHDGVISIDEFYFYFYQELCFKFPILRTGVNPGADLFNIFVKYATFGKAVRSEEMTSSQFSKLCKDCKLINNKTVLKADIDIIFSRCRAETEVLEAFHPKMGMEYTTARMMYPQFLFGLLKVAEKRRSGFQEVVARIIENVSAVPRASMADLLVFHNTGDPKLAEEWVARPRGLPQLPTLSHDASKRMLREAALAKNLKLPFNKDKLKGITLSQSVSNSVAPGDSAQGTQQQPQQVSEGDECDEHLESMHISKALASTKTKKQWGLQGYGSAEALGLPCVGRAALNDPRALIAIRKLNPDHLLMALKRVFERYTVWQNGVHKGHIDKVRFNKMMRDTKFVRECGPMTSTHCDYIFTRCLPMVEITLNFMQFLAALRHVAAALRISLNEVMESIVLINAPLST